MSEDDFNTIVSGNNLTQREDDVDSGTSQGNTMNADQEIPRQKWNWARIRLLSLYFLTTTILFSDVNLMAPNLSIIADEFGFNEDERDVKLGGMIALGFFFVGAPISYIIGWMADSINRIPLFAATVFIGEFGCMMVYFVQNYQQLYACRVLTGISIGGAIPIIFSVLGDLYPANQRSIVSAVITTGSGIGMGIGQVIAGLLDDWRLPFLVVSVPGIICSFVILFFNDPPRGANEAAVLTTLNVLDNDNLESNLPQSNDLPVLQADQDHECMMDPENKENGVNITSDTINSNDERPSDEHKMSNISCGGTLDLLKTPSVVLIILQAAPGSLPFGFCATFLNDFLQQERGMTKEAATGVLVTFGAGNAIGVVIGGLLGRSYKKDVRLPPLFMGISLIIGCIPFYFLLNHVSEDANTAMTAAVTAISGTLVVVPVPLERAILTNVCLPRSRGRANALVSITDDLGKGLGPALVSLLITTFDRQTAFNISLIGWIIGGVLSLLIIPFVQSDEEKVQHQLRDNLDQATVMNAREA